MKRSALAWCGVVVLAVGGCAPRGVTAPPVASAEGAFAPESLRIHPLTHLDKAEGRAIAVCHVELLDRWGDTVKGVGRLEVTLHRPLPGPGGVDAPEQVWDLDLSDWDLNASLYDSATRTYRLQLGELPAWVVGHSGEGPVCRLKATYVPRGSAEATAGLRDEFVVRR